MSAVKEEETGVGTDLVGNRDKSALQHDEQTLGVGDCDEVTDILADNLASGLVLKNGNAPEDVNDSNENSPDVSDETEKEQPCKCLPETENGSDGDKDSYDSHSDSIETLGEEGPPDEEGSLNGALISGLDFSKSDVVSAESTERNEAVEDQDDDLARDSIIVLAEQESDISVQEGHREVTRPESLSLSAKGHIDEDRKCSNHDIEAHFRGKHHLTSERDRSRSEGVAIVKSRARTSVEEEEKMSKSLPHGTIRRKGDLIEFVADDLQAKIKRSSPMSRTDSGSMGSRQSSMRSLSSMCSSTSASTSIATSSGLSRSPSTQFTQSPDDIPPIDPSAVIELENQARLVADNVDLMLGNLRANLHKMSAITIGCLEASKCSVDITCDSVDASIKSMYALMAKCEELSKQMPPVCQLAGQITEIKRLLDLFEAQLADKT